MGVGLDRLIMLIKQIDDIRLLRSSDPRIARQMLTLARYEAVSNQPATNRDLSICVGDPDMELLGDRIRNVLGERSVGGERGVALSIRLCIGSRKGA
jgi:phenylalanyl-tRNA synthetase alpha chain